MNYRGVQAVTDPDDQRGWKEVEFDTEEERDQWIEQDPESRAAYGVMPGWLKSCYKAARNGTLSVFDWERIRARAVRVSEDEAQVIHRVVSAGHPMERLLQLFEGERLAVQLFLDEQYQEPVGEIA